MAGRSNSHSIALKNEYRTIDKDGIVRLCKESRVYDYIMYEIFKKLPYDIQTFLINTSVLNILSTDLCNAVMNITTSKSLHWCQIQYLYFTDEREKALSLALPYLEDQQTMNIYMAYIKVVSSIILLHDNREDEAAVFMQEANKYLNNFQLDYPKLLKHSCLIPKGYSMEEAFKLIDGHIAMSLNIVNQYLSIFMRLLKREISFTEFLNTLPNAFWM